METKMIEIEQIHRDMVKMLAKPGHEILSEMSPDKMHLLHMVSKLCSEAGELMDAVGKNCYYNKPLDMNNILEELGDIEFYLEGFRNKLGIFRKETLEANYDKLSKRYEGLKYTDKAAHERKDKVTEQ